MYICFYILDSITMKPFRKKRKSIKCHFSEPTAINSIPECMLTTCTESELAFDTSEKSPTLQNVQSFFDVELQNNSHLHNNADINRQLYYKDLVEEAVTLLNVSDELIYR